MPGLEIDQHGAVSTAAAPSPIINAKDARRRSGLLKRIIMFTAAPLALAAFASPAAAQGIPVFDSSSYLQALATVQHTATMIQQGEQQITTATNTLSSLQKLTNVNSIAPQLFSSENRNILPSTTTDASTC